MVCRLERCGGRFRARHRERQLYVDSGRPLNVVPTFNPSRRMFVGSDCSTGWNCFVQLTVRNGGLAGDTQPSPCRPQPRDAPFTVALVSLRRGISPRIRSRISDASGQSGTEHSKSVWRRSSSPAATEFDR